VLKLWTRTGAGRERRGMNMDETVNYMKKWDIDPTTTWEKSGEGDVGARNEAMDERG